VMGAGTSVGTAGLDRRVRPEEQGAVEKCMAWASGDCAYCWQWWNEDEHGFVTKQRPTESGEGPWADDESFFCDCGHLALAEDAGQGSIGLGRAGL
jgi:hypothetical protein